MTTPAHLTPSKITPESFTHLLSLYPTVLRNLYATKIKDAKKRAEAVEDDEWRYVTLPGEVRRRREEGKEGKEVKEGEIEKGEVEGKGLVKEEVQRLVKWKITHGPNRPFLPSLIAKNPPSTISTTTHSALTSLPHQHQHSPPSTSSPSTPSLPTPISKSLKLLTTLSGIGPATATLILSVSDPDTIPFFADELAVWITGRDGKLKYTVKEYTEVFLGVREVRERLGVRAVEVEMVGFVLGHLDEISEDGGEGDRVGEGKEEEEEEEQGRDARKRKPVSKVLKTGETGEGRRGKRVKR